MILSLIIATMGAVSSITSYVCPRHGKWWVPIRVASIQAGFFAGSAISGFYKPAVVAVMLSLLWVGIALVTTKWAIAYDHQPTRLTEGWMVSCSGGDMAQPVSAAAPGAYNALTIRPLVIYAAVSYAEGIGNGFSRWCLIAPYGTMWMGDVRLGDGHGEIRGERVRG